MKKSFFKIYKVLKMLFLKSFSVLHKRKGCFLYPFAVAPHAGAWIEIMVAEAMKELLDVAPHAGAWIEIFEADGAYHIG